MIHTSNMHTWTYILHSKCWETLWLSSPALPLTTGKRAGFRNTVLYRGHNNLPIFPWMSHALPSHKLFTCPKCTSTCLLTCLTPTFSSDLARKLPFLGRPHSSPATGKVSLLCYQCTACVPFRTYATVVSEQFTSQCSSPDWKILARLGCVFHARIPIK